MKKIYTLAVAALLAMIVPAIATAQEVRAITVLKDASPTMHGRSLKFRAVVEAIDLGIREIIVKPASGRSIALRVDERVKNLHEVKAGDKVSVRYNQAVGISLRTIDPDAPLPEAQAEAAGSDSTGKPGTRHLSLMASVESVDEKGKTISIRAADDRYIDLYVRDAGTLASVKPGDSVEAVFTEAVAVLIDLPQEKIEIKKKTKKKK